jgi:Tfp pilus assembly protein PilV
MSRWEPSAPLRHPSRAAHSGGIQAGQRMKARLAEHGITTIEGVIVLALLAVVLVGVTGLHLLAISTGTAAETSSVATNLARARLEEVLGLPPSQILQQDNTQVLEQVPSGRGPTYTIRTVVTPVDPAYLDITVTVTWQVAYNSACASGTPRTACRASRVTYTRTLETRTLRRDNS